MHLAQPLSSKLSILKLIISQLAKEYVPAFLFGLPFILSLFTYLPLGAPGYELGKVIFFQLLVIMLASLYFINRAINHKTHLPYQKSLRTDVVLLTWFIFLIISCLINNNLDTAINGELFYQFGLISLFFILVFAWHVRQVSTKQLAQITAVVGMSVGMVHACLVALQSSFDPVVRPISSLGEPNWLGSIITISLLIGIWMLMENRYYLYRMVIISSLCFLGLILLLTQSRSAILSLGISSSILLLLNHLKLNQTKSLYIILSCLIGCFTFVLIMGLFPHQALQGIEGFSIRGIQGTDSRLWIYEKGIKLWLQKPLLGWGWEGISQAYSQVIPGTRPGINDLSIIRSHNLFLDLLLSSGIIGLGLFLYLMTLTFRKLLQNYHQSQQKIWLLLTVVGLSILIYGQFNPLSLTHWVFIGLLIGLQPLPSLHRFKTINELQR